MRRLPRRVWLLIAVGAVLLAGTILLQLITPAENSSTLPRGTTLSAAPQGSLALSQWLEAEEYGVERVRSFPFTGNNLAALFVITPDATGWSSAEETDITAYVERGGTLFLITDGGDLTSGLQRALDLRVLRDKPGITTATPSGPTLGRPPVATIALHSDAIVRPVTQGDARFLTRATSANGTVVATMARGRGRVHIVTGPYALSNAGIAEADNLALVQNLLAGLPAKARIGFDEYHHGYSAGTNIADLALRAPWGWALFYLAGLTLVAFVLNGRRFGRSLPIAPAPPQAPATYARALGNLWREHHHRDFAQVHIADALKRDLAAPFGLDPAADDAAFLHALATRDAALAAACAPLFTDLRAPVRNDAAFVALIRDADEMGRFARELGIMDTARAA